MKAAISSAAKFLEDAFDVLNEIYFESALSKPMITIQSTPDAYGHCTTYDAWQDDEGHARKEINIGAENLDRPIENLTATLVHEMVHLHCLANQIKDTSRGGTYHNKRFKQEAEQCGLVISYDTRIGWSLTQPAADLASLVQRMGWDKLGFARQGNLGKEKTRKASSTRKYVCPCCGQSVRATRKVNILCADCMQLMGPEDDET